MTFGDLSQCSTSFVGLGLEGRDVSHLCGLTSNFIAVNGFGDILRVDNRKLEELVGFLVRAVGFDIGCAQVATLRKGFFRRRVISGKGGYVSRIEGGKECEKCGGRRGVK